MVHYYEGLIGAPGGTFGEGHAHHKRPHQAGRIGDRHGVQIAPPQRRQARRGRGALQTVVADAADGLDVLAAGNFRHHAAETRMEINLGGHHIREQRALAVDNGCRRLVAGRLDG